MKIHGAKIAMTLPELVESIFCRPCKDREVNGECIMFHPEDHCEDFDDIVKICKAAQLAILEEMPGEPLKAGVWLRQKMGELKA